MAPLSLMDVGYTSEVDDPIAIKTKSKLESEFKKSKWSSKVVLELLKIKLIKRRKAMLKVDAE